MTDEKQQPPVMVAMDALEAEMALPPEVVNSNGEPEAPRRSIADFIPVETLLAFVISVMWTMSKKMFVSARDVDFTEGEIKTLSNAWAPVVADVMPDIPEGNLTTALMVTSVVVVPKVAQAKKAAKKRKKAAAEGEQTPAVVEQKQESKSEPVPVPVTDEIIEARAESSRGRQ